MKKVLSLVLVVALAIGMGSAAFANWGGTLWGEIVNLESIKEYAPSMGLIDGYEGNEYDDSYPHDINKYQGIQYDNDKSGVIKMGTVYAVDEPGLNIDLWNWMFQGKAVLDSSMTNTTTYYYAPALEKMYAQGLFKNTTWRPADIKSWTDYDNAVVDEWRIGAILEKLLKNGKLKIGTSGAVAGTILATPYEVAKAFGDHFYTNGMMEVVSSEKYTNLYFSKEMVVNGTYIAGVSSFTWNFGAPWVVDSTKTTNGARRLTITEIQKSNIKLNTQVSGNSAPIKKAELNANKGRIEFRTQKEWVSTKDAAYEIVLYLSIDGKRFDGSTVTITGTLDNKRIKVYKNMDFVDISEGYIAEPVDFNEKIAVYIGDGVTVHTKMFKDKLYYGITSREEDEEATVVFKQYKNVSNVVTLKTVGFANVNDYVTFSTDYAGYYVYDADLNYLGKADEQVEFSTRYYLADQKLDIEDDDDEEPEDDEPSGITNPGTGGENASPNVNANPGTGR